MSQGPHSGAMTTAEVLRELARFRVAGQIVVTNQRAAREWPRWSSHPLDLNYNPSAMGGAIPLALGLAMARPDREVWCVSGDGSLLMNLGCLVTVVESGVTNLSILLLDNGVYEVTGGQRVPGTGTTDFVGLARSAGFANVAMCDELADWRARGREMLASPGPRLIWLKVYAEQGDFLRDALAPITKRLDEFRSALQSRTY